MVLHFRSAVLDFKTPDPLGLKNEKVRTVSRGGTTYIVHPHLLKLYYTIAAKTRLSVTVRWPVPALLFQTGRGLSSL